MKKVITILLTVTLIVLLAGCTGLNKSNDYIAPTSALTDVEIKSEGTEDATYSLSETSEDYYINYDYENALQSTNNSNYEVGDIIMLGETSALHADWVGTKNNRKSEYSYRTESLEWQILEINGSCATVISVYIIDRKPFADDYDVERAKTLSWENCSIRKWLNEDLYENAFNDAEKEAILTTNVSNARLPEYDTVDGPSTLDNLYFLSLDEFYRYYPDKESRKNLDIVMGDVQMSLVYGFWLRTINKTSFSDALNTCSLVWGDGSVDLDPSPLVGSVSAKPVMNVDLNKLIELN